ncbi:glutamate-cysteine ligase family protein [Actinoplanes oblitus]|uniref:Glutamate-cysteine ligase family protein n=1 Tax=Actinoplanes oblitus TaxID=3040509 RepID=A0ABY8WG12_9ACTN|nr:glutamate-cysteine ligase family protein [Actinoplanes oblitus]WIM96593.1 glutamate-cysteine ligase family protein [Actinoplanes oblitus]
MGTDLAHAIFSPEDRIRYRHKVRRCLDVLGGLLDTDVFDPGTGMTGLEIEINLVDADASPVMRNAELLADLGDSRFQAELGRFNIELNVPPRQIAAEGFGAFEKDISEALRTAGERAGKADSRLLLIGMLPTLTPEHLTLANLSDNERFRALNDEIVAARGEQFPVDIRGVERLRSASGTIVPEAACTSAQFHLQVAPEWFARYWNASQAVAAAQVALGANSPFLHGRRLWAETRIALFEQATDTRPDELKAQGVRPRVWFGERWITSVFDLYEENVTFFPPLLPLLSDEDPDQVRAAGEVPRLGELCLHNGTVYRWNRPVYDVMDGRPHLRIENRVLPSGPTVVDLLANAAFYFGVIRRLAEAERPIWSRLDFATAGANFRAGARDGLDAVVCWPGLGEVPIAELVLETLLPLAYDGLDRFGVYPGDRDRLLGIIEDRCRSGRNGAAWQTAAVRAAEHRGLSRTAALREMTHRYLDLHGLNEPVHTWPM